ncbi:cytochrome c oxidase assembly protein [Actinocrinis puniceicyclus]|uniref:Cytochrome c oxidase assembly protein n=2 Tax=Actinocrinis puniceicyclus TaxID=977794 RepID=A0A8J7WKD0_9ACTN|nr:cytochrome c oxidase assembly protein [Actinocrinis puniceicyclus]MBS2963898.1 cytochrome c oxidase assembly protein [Actinocrinis puniceicyclus]
MTGLSAALSLSGMPGMPGMGGPPPPPSFARMWTLAPSPFFLVVIVVLLALYAAGMTRMLRRGDGWPIARAVSFLAGLVLLFAMTCTGLAEYGMYLFSAHMLQHMVLSMAVPLFLLLGAPITLMLRALRPAAAGHTGPRELLLGLLHSRFARVVSSPLFTLPLFVASLYGLYFTTLFDVLMRSAAGHDFMLVHFLAVGLLFFWPIMGVDPAPHRSPYVIRILELFAAMPFHAFFGVAVMMSSSLITRTFAHPPASWGVDPASDQSTGGGLAWAFGEVPTLIVLLVLFIQWSRSDEREARRNDRKADRDGDLELSDYNAYLAGLAAREQHVTAAENPIAPIA